MILAAGSPFDPVYNFFGAILAFFYGIIPNLGISIILLTVLVMLVLFPLTAKQAKAMMAMQRAQPEIKKLQAKYKNDRSQAQRRGDEVLPGEQDQPARGLLATPGPDADLPRAFPRDARALQAHPEGLRPLRRVLYVRSGVLHTEECNVPKLGLPKPQYFLGMDLSQHATGVTGGFLDALPYFLLVGLVIVTAFLQARQSRRNAPNMTSQMAIITNILPIAFGLFSLQFPAGLVLYFLVSNLWRLGQQEIIMRKITRPGQAAIAASAAASGDDAIDVKSKDKDTARVPAAAGGLRKLFQLPAAGNGAGDTSGEANGKGESTATNGAGKPAAGKPKAGQPSGGSKSSGPGKGSTGGAQTGGSGSGGSASSARRRNSKKRKRR